MAANERPDNWFNDAIQFPRLLAELGAAGVEANAQLMADAAESMDLEPSDLSELFDRAQAAWDAIVAVTPSGPFPTIVWPPADDACSRCGAELSPIDRDNEHDTRKGEPGDLRCTDETCPYSDYPQGYRFTEG